MTLIHAQKDGRGFPGIFIVLDGPEGCGKTTQLERLAGRIRALGFEVVTTKEPGGIPQTQKYREEILGKDNSPEEEFELFCIDRRIHMNLQIIPELEAGKVVLCDRFSNSSFAYQYWGGGLRLSHVLEEDKKARHGIQPDLVLIFNLPSVRVMRERLAQRQERLDSIERRGDEFHERVMRGFREMARQRLPFANTYLIQAHFPNAQDPIRTVEDLVWEACQRNLGARLRKRVQ